ncbi:DoxX family protein [Noviherbaspirillum sp.]|uniref:DoxX family protein n=1 Tax=Noviherbaspirillum sp. TaxID=1926288 RepID=UPI002D24E0CB|nr:DoxX family protein [Noviherbaspirillum sp.]HZW21344.1 DoxX family protein [Noviherbaspirillum sp.]
MIDHNLSPYAATLLRASLGAMWISHALLKLLVFTIPGFEGFLASHGMPAFVAWPVVLMEIAGGTLILLGWHGRIASLLLLPILIGAMAAHLGNGWVFSNANGGWEYPLFLIAMSVVHGMLGDGAFALSGDKRRQALRLKTA